MAGDGTPEGYVGTPFEDRESLKGVQLTIDELNGMTEAFRGGFRELVKWGIRHIASEARAHAPTSPGGGTLRDAIKEITFDNGDVGKVYVDRMRDPRKGKGRMSKVPIFVEYGTIKSKASPYLIPAFHYARGEFDRRVERLLRESVKG